jgi:hypothetical protein
MPQHIIKRRPWTTEEDNLLRELLATKKLSFNQMARHFPGRNGTSLRKHARVHLGLANEGFVLRKHTYNQAFFQTPNPINCYVAGFYAADGYIGDNPTTRLLTISLAPQDGHQVETFKQLMEYSGNVTIDSRSHEGRCDMHSLRLYSAYQITADLERNFGLTNRKTHRIPAPNLTDPHLKLCYLAGLLDGDGCVHINVQNRVVVRYVSASRAIVDWVKAFVDGMGLQTLKRGRHYRVRKETDSAAFAFTVGGLKAVDLIRRIQRLKAEGIPILDRKWDNPRINAYISDFCARHGVTV